MKKYLFLLTVVLSFLLVQAAAAELVQNGGFETGDFSNWTVIPASSDSDIVVENEVLHAHSGNFSAFFGAFGTTDDAITQTIPTIAGQTYTFSFWLYHGFAGDTNDFNAFWNGTQVLGLVNLGVSDYTQHSFTVTGTGTDTIKLLGTDLFGLFNLDDVSVTPATAIPLPGTLMLLSSGLAGLAGLGWRKVRKS